VGAFVSALEEELLGGRIDIAVHSLKDLQTAPTAGLQIAAVPPRGAVHDVLITRTPARLDDITPGLVVGTGSPRRAAQLRELGDFDVVPVRGNVPTRLDKLDKGDLEAVVLAAAGLERLGIKRPHSIALPVERFLPAPGQGALAVQTRETGGAADLARAIDDRSSRSAVTAERALLKQIAGGCHAPVGALASVREGSIVLHGRLFTEDHRHKADGIASGEDPVEIGMSLAERLMSELSREKE
jgi:hydroxymethylbilane synthase